MMASTVNTKDSNDTAPSRDSKVDLYSNQLKQQKGHDFVSTPLPFGTSP